MMKIRVIVILIAFLFVFSSNVWAGLHPGTDVDLIHENEETRGGGNTTPGSSSGSSSKSEAQKYLEELKKKHEGTAKQALKKRGEGLFGDGWYTSWYTSNDRTVIRFSATQKTAWSDTKIKYYRWQYKSFQASPEAIQQGKNPSGKMQYPSGRQERKIGATWTSPTRRITVRLFDDGTYKFTSRPYGDKITYETYTIRATIIYSDTYPSLVGEGWTYTSTIEKGRKHDQPIGREETHIAEGPGDVELGKDKELQTTSTWIFSRRYACTNDIKDNLTNKPYELEVTYILEANTTITEVLRPEHIITRYKNLGTMTVLPVAWKASKQGKNKVLVWAKFSHPKAAVPGKSPMIFRTRVKTKDGTHVVTEQIDVPVNTINLRFTDVPESETGEFYPIQGLTKFNNREFVKKQPPIYHANIFVP